MTLEDKQDCDECPRLHELQNQIFDNCHECVIKAQAESVERVPVEVELDEETLATMEYISKETGFSLDQIVEYSLADRLITEALRKRKVEQK